MLFLGVFVWRSYIRQLWRPALLFIFVVMLLPEPLLGRRPASYDHVVHYAKATSFLHRLPTLDLWSWDWSMFAGYPTEYGYPITAEVAVTLVYGLALGSISIGRAYGLAFFATYLFGAGAVYWTFSRWIGRVAAAIAVFFFVTDYGDFSQGGWLFTSLFGVWPAFLSIAVGLILLERLVARVRGEACADWLLGLLLGVTWLSHPMQLVFVPLMIGALVLWIAIEPALRHDGAIGRLARSLAVAVPLAAALAAFWYVPFLMNARYTLDRGYAGVGVVPLALGVLTAHPFSEIAPIAAWAGLGGIIAAWMTRGPVRLIAVVCCLGMVAMTTLPRDVVLALSGLDLNHKLEFPRFTMLVKPFWFAAAAWGLTELAKFVHAKRGRLGLGVLLAATLAAVAIKPSVVTLIQIPFPMILREPSDVERMREVGAWLDARAGETAGVFRAAHSPTEVHDLVELGTLTRVPLVKYTYTPAVNFSSNLLPISPELANLVGLRYFVVSEPLDDPQRLQLRTQLGGYFIYENPDWIPSPVTVLEGRGTIANAALAPRAIRFEAEPGAAGTALIAAGYFPNWRATRDGRPIPIAPYAFEKTPSQTLMTVPLAPGTYQLRFVRRRSERIAFLLSIAAWVVVPLAGVRKARLWRTVVHRAHRILGRGVVDPKRRTRD